jgi:hypothetical protein
MALSLLPLAAFAQGPLTFHLSGGLFQDWLLLDSGVLYTMNRT